MVMAAASIQLTTMRLWVLTALLTAVLVEPGLARARQPAPDERVGGAATDSPTKTLAARPAKRAKRGKKKAKYYFNLGEVTAESDIDTSTKDQAREALEAALAERPEFTSDLGDPVDGVALAEALERRKLQGFNVNLKIASFSKEDLPPKPGGRLPQLAVGIKLSVFGTTIPEAKLAFGGDGEAVVQAEVVESRMDKEVASLTKDAVAAAVKQAVDDAVAKLGRPVSAPMNESQRRRRKKP